MSTRFSFVLLITCVLAVHAGAQVKLIDNKGTFRYVDSSKWKLSGINIFNKNTGNVGIGTNAPAAKLHTVGTVRLESLGTSTSNTNMLTADVNGNITTRTIGSLLSTATINSLSLSTNTLTSTVNGVTATSNAVSGVSNSSSTNNLTTTVNGVTGANVPIINSNTLTGTGNKITSTVNGIAADLTPAAGTIGSGKVLGFDTGGNLVAGTAPLITTNTLTLSGSNLTSTVNGVASSQPLSSLSTTTTGVTITGTNNILSAGTINIATANASQQGLLSSGDWTTFNNKISSEADGVIGNEVTNATASGGLVRAGSGTSGSPYTLGIANAGVTSAMLNQMGAATNQVLTWNGTSWVPATSPTGVSSFSAGTTGLTPSTATTGAVTLAGVLNPANGGTGNASVPATGVILVGNGTTYSPLAPGTSGTVLTSNGTGSSPSWTAISAPDLLVDASRTSSYSPGSAYATLAYNSATVNVGASYNTTTGVFTAPATGLYQVIVNNLFSPNAASDQSVRTRIVVNGTVDMEFGATGSPYTNSSNRIFNTSGSTMVNLSSGQTITIQIGDEVNTTTPLTGSGQHRLKIIRLK